MTIDSRVVNGRIVDTSGVAEHAISIDGGRVIADVGASDDVWRTVDASGYFVLPGLVQPGSSCGEDAVNAARLGVTTVLPRLSASTIEELATTVAAMESRSNLDHVPVWTLPDGVDQSTIDHARSLGISVFDAGEAAPDPSLLNSFDGATVRIPVSTEHLADWMEVSDERNIRIVVTGVTSNHLDRAGGFPSGTYLETDVASLASGDRQLWDALRDRVVDIVAQPRPNWDRPLLQFLYHEGTVERDLPLSRIAELAAITPSRVYGLVPAKGSFDLESDGDLLVFDPDNSDRNNTSPWPGRVIFSLQRGNILLYNDELHALPGDGQRLGG